MESSVDFMGGLDTREITISIPVYRNYSAELPGYIVERGTLGFSYMTDIFTVFDGTNDLYGPSFFSTDEFINLSYSYGFFQMLGIEVSFIRSYPELDYFPDGLFMDLPSMYIDLIPPVFPTNALYPDHLLYVKMAYDSDTHLHIQPNNTNSNPPSKYYAFPSVVQCLETSLTIDSVPPFTDYAYLFPAYYGSSVWTSFYNLPRQLHLNLCVSSTPNQLPPSTIPPKRLAGSIKCTLLIRLGKKGSYTYQYPYSTPSNP